ncbi:MAG: NAD(P)/FAD-dependent oxidoreductase [Clostridiales bacterium]|jgi:pyruvate/2-oxoglutarate dehydrogenase complex dihydrolipoamide dehydrogenase (E3) component|nr:NAD(P)/FAD-dependent oxidoreductase [Clostridiales bacterium]
MKNATHQRQIRTDSVPVFSPPRIKGIDLPFVMDCHEASTHKERWGERLVIIGGGANGLKFALEQSLIKGAHSVIIEVTDTLASKVLKDFRVYAKQLFDKTGLIETLTETRCTDITPGGVNIESTDGSKRFITCDSVIYCGGLGAPSSNELEAYFKCTPQTYIIGDCRMPRMIKDAVVEGYNIAQNI